MRYGETGYNLEVDLATGNIERMETDPELTALYLGGLGTNLKLIWDRVPPGTKPFDPENLFIIGAGLFCGTMIFAGNRTVISTISPQTHLLAYPMSGGFWASELKYAGYDKVIFRNKSDKLIYLWIHNDKVEIRDAAHLKGKGAVETVELIQKELNEPNAQVAAIGLAGENRVFTASIEIGKGSASRLGGGAVMGDKNIKAVAVRGTKTVHFAQPEEFMKRCIEVRDYTRKRMERPLPGFHPILAELGVQEMKHTDEKWHTENFVWGNARTRRKDFWTKENEENWTSTQLSAVKRLISCFNCPAQCGAVIEYKDVPTYQMKCFSKLTYAMAAFVDDLDFGFRIARRAFDYGLDSFSTPQILAFGIELHEAGILTDKDFEGSPADKEGRFLWLLDRVARREGIGDILADGVYWAARKIGNGAEKYDHNTIKKHEQLPLKLGMLNPLYYLMYSTNEKISITQIEGVWPQEPLPTREEREAFVSDWVNVPDDRFKEWYVDWEPRGENALPFYPTVDMCCEIVDWMETSHVLDDALGLCCSMSSFMLKTPYHIHNLPGIISSLTGLDMDEAELLKIAKRNRNLHRAVNNRFGLTRKDEKPPDDHWKKRFPELEKELMDAYYKFKGWNMDGVPTRKTLEELDLGYVADDLEKRGILKDGQD